jgi:hypothetical protein
MSVPSSELGDGLIDRQHQRYYSLNEIGPEKYLSGEFHDGSMAEAINP